MLGLGTSLPSEPGAKQHAAAQQRAPEPQPQLVASFQRAKPASKPPTAPSGASASHDVQPTSAQQSAQVRQRTPQAQHAQQMDEGAGDAPPSYDDIIGVADSPASAGSGDDSSTDMPHVPSVYIYIGGSATPIQHGQQTGTTGHIQRAAQPQVDAQPGSSIRQALQKRDDADRVAASAASVAAAAAPRPRQAAARQQAKQDAAPAPFIDTSAAAPAGTTGSSASLVNDHSRDAAPAAAQAQPEADLLGGTHSGPLPDAHHSPGRGSRSAMHSPPPNLLGGEDAPAAQADPRCANVDDLDDFFQAGAAMEARRTASSDDIFAAAPQALARGQAPASAAKQRPADADLIGGMANGAEQDARDDEPGDRQLERQVADAQAACATLPPGRAAKIHEAVTNARAYVDTRMVRLLPC